MLVISLIWHDCCENRCPGHRVCLILVSLMPESITGKVPCRFAEWFNIFVIVMIYAFHNIFLHTSYYWSSQIFFVCFVKHRVYIVDRWTKYISVKVIVYMWPVQTNFEILSDWLPFEIWTGNISHNITPVRMYKKPQRSSSEMSLTEPSCVDPQ